MPQSRVLGSSVQTISGWESKPQGLRQEAGPKLGNDFSTMDKEPPFPAPELQINVSEGGGPLTSTGPQRSQSYRVQYGSTTFPTNLALPPVLGSPPSDCPLLKPGRHFGHLLFSHWAVPVLLILPPPVQRFTVYPLSPSLMPLS